VRRTLLSQTVVLQEPKHQPNNELQADEVQAVYQAAFSMIYAENKPCSSPVEQWPRISVRSARTSFQTYC
jgi:hypothetical protein